MPPAALLKSAPSHLDIGGERVPVLVRINARARRLILKVDPVTGDVVLVIPHRESLKDALAFARRQAHWIAGRRRDLTPAVALLPGDTVPFRGEDHAIIADPAARRGVWLDDAAAAIRVSGQAEHVPRRVRDWLRRMARDDLTRSVADHAGRLDVRPTRVTLRDTRSRWGSCSASGALSFSWRLILAPPFVLDYVAAHEVAHLVHHDHSPAFWALVRDLIGDPGTPTAWLKRHGTDLHRFGAGCR